MGRHSALITTAAAMVSLLGCTNDTSPDAGGSEPTTTIVPTAPALTPPPTVAAESDRPRQVFSEAQLEYFIGKSPELAIEFAEANEMLPVVYLLDQERIMDQDFNRIQIDVSDDRSTVLKICNC